MSTSISTMTQECIRFIQDIVVASMMGASLALVNIPETDREKFIERWTSDATRLAFALHKKVHDGLGGESHRS